ncbi:MULTISPECIES: 3-oxoacyl-ACP synthase III family protein [unclassified Adlercreutzia]|uniref:3-oxoacyl-ACP synthase III family protein n=1 Tax=unclassified Adlercreutzia TaxID=2636013 RepID=UPI0013ECABD0|nr:MULTISPECIES: beta-ketoacyl-ACP synthase III [unclassified Adlercreutzia]
MGAVIIGSGKALPRLEVANDELKALVDTNDEWISSRTGISTRHIAVDESAQELAYAASCAAMGIENTVFPQTHGSGWCENSIDPSSIDLVLYATVSPDAIVPSCAALLKRNLGLTNAVAMDVNAACTGFIYNMTVAEAMLAASNACDNVVRVNSFKRALVVGVDRLSRLTDWQDRNTCVLFGDGAGAAVLDWQPEKTGIMASYIRNDDDIKNSLTCANAIEALQPFCTDGVNVAMADKPDESIFSIDQMLGISEDVANGKMRQVIRMDGRTIFKFASNAMTNAVTTVLDNTGLSLDDIDCIVPHQANERIIRFAAKKLGIEEDKFQLSIDHTGNTSSASVPMALADAYTNGRIKRGDKVIIVAFGGGLTSGAVLFEA